MALFGDAPDKIIIPLLTGMAAISAISILAITDQTVLRMQDV
jgi:hypothetical protein